MPSHRQPSIFSTSRASIRHSCTDSSTGESESSARTIEPGVHVGHLLSEAFGEYGSFGGHHDMGAGWIDLGLYGNGTTDEDRLLSIVDEGIGDRFFETLGLSRTGPM
ncbi:MAG: DHH family phosphoesterase [Natrialbaceae archaeon]|nr:DHH family phosphoesterase [Natrialbaceae archaeon]